MHKSKKRFRKKISRTKKNKCVYTDEAKRIVGLMKELYISNKITKTKRNYKTK
jgi:hypothetical protein